MTSAAPSADLLGSSSAIAAVREQVALLLRREAQAGRLPPILIEGETGTGKGLLARLIHRRSTRASAPFVDVNCAAIPESLLEAELFGFERGAFTDARHAKPGLFQAAHRGVLFLDEIGLLPDILQGKVLKAIDERLVRRLGSLRAEATDTWIIAATSADLVSATRARRFREDLYHRLAALTLKLPPLRARSDDVELLAEHFLGRACADYQLPAKTLDEGARHALRRHAWPGNVRELSNVMERVALLSDDRQVTAAVLGLQHRAPPPEPNEARTDAAPLREAVGDVERRHIVEILRETGWNVSRAAAKLGIPRSSLRYRLEKHGLQSPGAGPVAPFDTVPRVDTVDPTIRPMTETANDLRVRAVDWQDRHLALLQVMLTPDADRESGRRPERLVQTLLEKVQSLGGHLDEQAPTGFVAVFGLEPVEDACVRAAHAALSVQNAVRRARDDDPATSTVTCALHAGQVLAGHAGAGLLVDMRARYRARGILEALSSTAEDGATLVSEAAARLLERRFHLEPVSLRALGAGRSYRLLARERTGYGLAGRPLTPFVGRAGDMALLDTVRARVVAGHGQVVALVGEPGVGKSRITYELARAAREQGWMVLEGHAASYGAATPYFAVADLLRRYLRLEDADGMRPLPERLRARLTALPDQELRAVVPPLLSVLGGSPIDDDEWRRLEPPQRRERILDGVKRVLLRESVTQPLLVLLEDLHWIDAGTQACLDRLVESLATARIMLLTSYRHEYMHGWGGKTYYRELQIDPLPPESAALLLDALLGADTALDPVKQLVIARTEGNPFFIEETVCALVETGVLAGERGAYRVTRVLEDLHVPATVEALLAARVERLRPEDRRLLQVAAVVGKDVPVALLEEVADLSGDALRHGLDRLRSAEFLYESGLHPDLAYCFKHALTHEVAYGGVSLARRRELHARIVDAIETLHRDHLGEHVERLAHHAWRGDLRDKAVTYLRRAALSAAARSAPLDARTKFEQALGILETLPDSPSNLEQAFDLRLELRSVMQQLGEGRAMLQRLREAEVLAERLNDDHRRGLVCALATNDHSRLEELDEALVAGARALDIARRLGDMRLRILGTSFLAQAHYYRGEYEQAVALARDNLAASPPEWVYEHLGNSVPASVYDRACLVRSLADLGRFAEAAIHEAEAIRIAESTQHAFTIAAAYWAAGSHHLVEGDWAKARVLIDRELAVVHAGSLVFLRPFAVAVSAWALAQLGEADEARDRLDEGTQLIEPSIAGAPAAHRTWVYHSLGRAALLLGQLDAAQCLAERAAETARSQRGFAAVALQLLGEIATHPDWFDPARAEACYREALALAGPVSMRPLIAHCRLGLGRVYRRTGQLPGREHLEAATTMYRDMGMAYWLAKAEKELGT